MERISTPSRTTVSFDRYGSGPPLVLVHGGFSDHVTNWQEARPWLADRFTVWAVARRGRGGSSATAGHTVDDEASDVAAVLRRVGEPAFLLGHSYGALVALRAAARQPACVRKLVLYEPPHPQIVGEDVVARLEAFGEREDWDGLVEAFMLDVLQVPPAEVKAIRKSPFWNVWTADAPASLHDLRAAVAYSFEAARYRALDVPVLLLIGSESPRELYVTDALASILPDPRIHALVGQAHEGMTTDPAQFVEVITDFLLADPPASSAHSRTALSRGTPVAARRQRTKEPTWTAIH